MVEYELYDADEAVKAPAPTGENIFAPPAMDTQQYAYATQDTHQPPSVPQPQSPKYTYDADPAYNDDSGLLYEAQDAVGRVYRQFGADVFLIFLASVAVTTQAADVCKQADSCEKNNAYAVAVGTVSLFITLIYCVFYALQKLNDMVVAPVAIFLMMWWTIGVGILTFDSPFASLGVANGYVGCWLGFAMSAKFCHEKVSQVNSWGTLFTEAASLKRYAVVLGVASTVVFFAGISVGEKSNTYNGKTIWAIVCGAFSLCIAICLFVLHEPLSKHLKWIGIFLVALWIAGVAVITFFGPFIAAGNGYFGSIAALLISVVILHSRSTDASSSDDAVDGGYADPGASVYDRYGDAV
eukprot:m.202660 g.202660  ORF g.202660 m.202660 type:complete len:353 (+) comp18839_c1_seq9:213-1271(+)